MQRYFSLVVFGLISVTLSAEYFLFGEYSLMPPMDHGAAISYAVAQARLSQLNFWSTWFHMILGGFNSYSTGWGMELFGVLYWLFPPWLATGVILVVNRFVAGFFTYRLLKDRFRVTPLAAFSAGLLISFDSLLYIEYLSAVSMLPFICWYFLRKTSYQGMWGFILLGVLYSGLSRFHTNIFAIPIVVGVVLVFRVVSIERSVKALFYFAVPVILIESYWVILSFMEAANSNRAGVSAPPASFLIQSLGQFPPDLKKLFRMGYMISNPPLYATYFYFSVLTVGAIFSFFSIKNFRLAVGFAAFYIVATMFDYTWIGLLSQSDLPILSGLRPRIYIAMPFFLALLTGQLVSVMPRSIQALSVGLLLFPLASMSYQEKVLALQKIRAGSSYKSHFQNRDLIQLRSVAEKEPLARALVIQNEPFCGYCLQWTPIIRPMDLSTYGIESIGGVSPLYPGRMAEYWDQLNAFEMLPGRHGFRVPRYSFIPPDFYSRTVPCEGVSEATSLEKVVKVSLLRQANVKFVVSPFVLEDSSLRAISNREPQEGYKFRCENSKELQGSENHKEVPLYTYRLDKSAPRFFCAEKVKFFTEPTEVLMAMAAESIEGIGKTAYVATMDLSLSEKRMLSERSLDLARSCRIEIESYRSNFVKLRVSSSKEHLLVILNSFSDGWRVKVNGQAGALFRLNHSFMGTLINAGESEVVLSHDFFNYLRSRQSRF